MKNKSRISIIFLLLVLGCSKGSDQAKPEKNDYYERCRLLVLQEDRPNQNYQFKRDGREIDEQTINYLGYIITNKKDTLKIISSVNFSGLFNDSKRGNGNIYIYDKSNHQIGFYNVGSALAIPKQIINNRELLFDYKNDICDQVTKVNLSDSIPKKIFVKCTSEGGDLYNFKKISKQLN